MEHKHGDGRQCGGHAQPGLRACMEPQRQRAGCMLWCAASMRVRLVSRHCCVVCMPCSLNLWVLVYRPHCQPSRGRKLSHLPMPSLGIGETHNLSVGLSESCWRACCIRRACRLRPLTSVQSSQGDPQVCPYHHRGKFPGKSEQVDTSSDRLATRQSMFHCLRRVLHQCD